MIAVLRRLRARHARVGASPVQNVHHPTGPGGGDGRRKEGMEKESGGRRKGEKERKMI